MWQNENSAVRSLVTRVISMSILVSMSQLSYLDKYILAQRNLRTSAVQNLILHIQFPKMNVRRLLSYEAKLLFLKGRGRM